MDAYEDIPTERGDYYSGMIDFDGRELPTEALSVRGPGNVTYQRVWPMRTPQGVGLIHLDFSLN